MTTTGARRHDRIVSGRGAQAIGLSQRFPGMRVQRGKTTVELTREELLAAASRYARVIIDIGTGDGRFVYRWAGEHPDTYCIGVDPVGERMRDMSHRVTRKPARGGRDNALFVVASVHALPDELRGLADTMTINFPWASLLKALVLPDPDVLAGLRGLVREGGELVVLFNQSVFEDRAYAERLALPRMDEARVRDVLHDAYLGAGFEIVAYEPVEGDGLPLTTWGQHLTLGSGRKAQRLTARARATSR